MALNTEEKHYFYHYFQEQIKNAQELKDFHLITQASGGSGDICDQASHMSHELLERKLMGRDKFYTLKIKEALHRLEQGTYGDCRECGAEIGLQRLMCRPTATECIDCKEEMERAEKHIPYVKRSKTIGKSLFSQHSA